MRDKTTVLPSNLKANMEEGSQRKGGKHDRQIFIRVPII